jgi:DNA-binding IclR family transcriptional regulator
MGLAVELNDLQGKHRVEVLADRTGVSIANASQHLQHMLRAGLVANRCDGKFRCRGVIALAI